MPDSAPGPVPSDYDGARHLVAGMRLPSLTLPSTKGGEVNLAERKGTVIVYVYPWTGRHGYDDPPGWDDIAGAHGSTPETAGFRDLYQAFRNLGVDVFGLSTQSPEHQRELDVRLALPFAVLSDESFGFQAALKLPTFMAGDIAYLRRLTFVVQNGCIQHVIYPVDHPEGHAADVLDWLRKRQASD